MDVTNALNAVFIVVALVAGGLTALQQGTLKAVRADNADLRLRDADRDHREADRELVMAGMAAEIVQLKNDRDVLASNMRSDDHIERLTADVLNVLGKIDEHHTEAKEHWLKDEGLLTEVRDRLPGGTP